MLICNERNFITCDPACPHIGPHEAAMEASSVLFEYEIYCDQTAKYVYRDDRPLVRCVEVKQ